MLKIQYKCKGRINKIVRNALHNWHFLKKRKAVRCSVSFKKRPKDQTPYCLTVPEVKPLIFYCIWTGVFTYFASKLCTFRYFSFFGLSCRIFSFWNFFSGLLSRVFLQLYFFCVSEWTNRWKSVYNENRE